MKSGNIFLTLTNVIFAIIIEIFFVGLLLMASLIVSYAMTRIF